MKTLLEGRGATLWLIAHLVVWGKNGTRNSFIFGGSMRSMTRFLIVIGFLFTTSFSQSHAFTGLEVDAGWSLPTQIGARLKGFFNDTFYISGGLGYSPGFTSGATEFMTFGPSQEGAYILSQALSDAFVIDLRAGYQQQVDSGFYIEGSYAFFSGGKGDITRQDLFDYDTTYNSVIYDYEIESDIHTLGGYAGYVFKALDLVLKAEVGLVKPISSKNSAKNSLGVFDVVYPNLIEDDLESLWSEAFIFTAGMYVIIPIN
ncbi:MAG: hypothetical protein CL677_03740 [Bdellovibrionaceae bacterium]|nr:hypothetical protein [Pseudobdellovibrionaceae bacterium]